MSWWKWINIACIVTLVLVIGIKLLTEQQSISIGARQK